MSEILILIFFNLLISTSYQQNVNYKKLFEIENEITGTGNLLQDIIYKTQCISIKCTYCCQGKLNDIKCATYEICNKYKFELLKYTRFELVKIILSVTIPYLLIPLLWMILYCTKEQMYPKFYKTISKIFVIYSGILLPPYGIVRLLELKWPNIRKYNIREKEDVPPGQIIRHDKLFHEKEFIRRDFEENCEDWEGNYLELRYINGVNSANNVNYDLSNHVFTDIKIDKKDDNNNL